MADFGVVVDEQYMRARRVSVRNWACHRAMGSCGRSNNVDTPHYGYVAGMLQIIAGSISEQILRTHIRLN